MCTTTTITLFIASMTNAQRSWIISRIWRSVNLKHRERILIIIMTTYRTIHFHCISNRNESLAIDRDASDMCDKCNLVDLLYLFDVWIFLDRTDSPSGWEIWRCHELWWVLLSCIWHLLLECLELVLLCLLVNLCDLSDWWDLPTVNAFNRLDLCDLPPNDSKLDIVHLGPNAIETSSNKQSLWSLLLLSITSFDWSLSEVSMLFLLWISEDYLSLESFIHFFVESSLYLINLLVWLLLLSLKKFLKCCLIDYLNYH